MRHQRDKAQYYSLGEAEKFINPSTSVLVIENAGDARAHSDYDLARPHLASSPDGLGGEKNVIMAYCSMANLGMGYTKRPLSRQCGVKVPKQFHIQNTGSYYLLGYSNFLPSASLASE